MKTQLWDTLYHSANLATMAGDNDYGEMRHAAIAVKHGKIAWMGAQDSLLDHPQELANKVVDVGNRWITPSFIDCHTHLIYGGNRLNEFTLRMQGADYESLAKAGGGILSTVAATRQHSESELLNAAMARAKALMREGVYHIEIKSGYGLDLASERKMLRVARQLEEALPINVYKTFLGAHAVPEEFNGDTQRYIDHVCQQILPELTAQGLIDAVDGFCETIAFTPAHIEQVFKVATDLNLPVKLHAEQLSDQGGAALVAKYQGLSADHLEYVSKRSVNAMAKAGTVAVLLPGAYYYLQQSKKPPVDLLREKQIPIAIATDCNPGTSPMCSINAVMNMACILFGLTPAEALAGITINAAKALAIDEDYGSLEVGKLADMLIWDISHPAELAYQIGVSASHERYVS